MKNRFLFRPSATFLRRFFTRGSSDNFPILNGSIDTVSSNYDRIYKANFEAETKIRQGRERAIAGGGERAVKRHVETNKKLLVRERLRLLLDESVEDHFLEIGLLAGCHGLEYGDVPAAGVVAGVGRIRGRPCMILANDATVKGGTVYPITVKKQLRGQELAEMLRLPTIYVVDSGGAFLPLQKDIFPDRHHGGRVFYNEAVMGANGLAQIALVCGSCTAGAAYIPTMADDAIIVERIGSVFLGGPPLVRAALGEIISSEELGGAKLHCQTSGCTDYFAKDESTAYSMCRDVVDALREDEFLRHIGQSRITASKVEPPIFSAEELTGIAGEAEPNPGYIYRVLSRILDGSRFREFRQMYGASLIVGYGRLGGKIVGVVAGVGTPLDEKSALKASQFIQMCDQRRLPLLFLQNTRHDGWTDNGPTTLKAVAGLISAIATTNSYKIVVNIGDCFGSDNFAMCGRSMQPAFSFMWPNASLGFCRPSSVVALSEDDAFPAEECTAIHAASNLWIDDVILPSETRRVLIQCLNVLPHNFFNDFAKRELDCTISRF